MQWHSYRAFTDRHSLLVQAKVRKEHNALLAELWQERVDFYAATARFYEDDPAGRMIRGIPTVSRAPGGPPAEPAAAPKES